MLTQATVDVHGSFVYNNSILKGPTRSFKEAGRANSGASAPGKATATAQNTPRCVHSATCVVAELELGEKAKHERCRI